MNWGVKYEIKKTKMEQSPVEWLQECLNSHLSHDEQMRFEGLFQQAKEMEKNRMIEFAFNFYYDTSNMLKVPFNKISENRILSEDYYEKTFNDK